MKEPPKAGVLLVDDVVEMRYLLRILLANVTRCHVIGEAENGEEAVALARTLQPDIVVLDVQMPRMNGLEALPLIKQAVPHARVIVYSSRPDAASAAMELGAFRYLEKGTDPMQVPAAVRDAVGADA